MSLNLYIKSLNNEHVINRYRSRKRATDFTYTVPLYSEVNMSK